MNRSKIFKRRKFVKEEVHESVLVHRLICKIMLHGRKRTASKLVYETLSELGTEFKKEPKEVLDFCIQKLKPSLNLRSKKIASSVYKIPVQVTTAKGLTVAMGWLVKGARERKEKGFKERLKGEIRDVINDGKSVSMKNKEVLMKIAEKNRAFLHYL